MNVGPVLDLEKDLFKIFGSIEEGFVAVPFHFEDDGPEVVSFACPYRCNVPNLQMIDKIEVKKWVKDPVMKTRYCWDSCDRTDCPSYQANRSC